jgi:hypothetical protein
MAEGDIGVSAVINAISGVGVQGAYGGDAGVEFSSRVGKEGECGGLVVDGSIAMM